MWDNRKCWLDFQLFSIFVELTNTYATASASLKEVTIVVCMKLNPMHVYIVQTLVGSWVHIAKGSCSQKDTMMSRQCQKSLGDFQMYNWLFINAHNKYRLEAITQSLTFRSQPYCAVHATIVFMFTYMRYIGFRVVEFD